MTKREAAALLFIVACFVLAALLLSSCATRFTETTSHLTECERDVHVLAKALMSCGRDLKECTEEADDLDEDIVFCKRGELKL